MYNLYYNSQVPVEQLTPVLTLDNCLQEANNGNHSNWTKLVRLNWMIQDLKYNSIQKPFLVDENYKIITGDTRYMATQFYPSIQHVPCLMTAKNCDQPGWVDIHNKKELGKLLDIHPENIITNHDWHQMPLDWIEFAYPHTSNHMHNESQRERMINNYLAKYTDTIFDQEWLLSNIDWSKYDY